MNAALQVEVAVPQPLPQASINRRLKPLRRQCHDKHSRRTDCSPNHHHSIGRKLLGQRAYDRREEDDKKRIDTGQHAHRGVRSQLAIAELWEDIIHLQKDRLEKSDEKKERQQPVKRWLTNKPLK